MHLPSNKHNLIFTKTVTSWDEAIPLGNGISGALLWGTPNAFRFSLDRTDIWDTTPNPEIFKEDFTYEKMVELVSDRNEEEIRKRFSDIYNCTLPTKLPAGKLFFKFNSNENVVSNLSLARAEARIKLGGATTLKSFLNATKNLGMISISCPESDFSYTIENPDFGVEGIDDSTTEKVYSVNASSLKNLVYPAPEIFFKGDTKYFIQKVGGGLSYGIFAKHKAYKNRTEIAFTVATSNDTENWVDLALSRLNSALENGYRNEFEPHKKWWSDFWSKSSLNLPNKFFEKNWYLTNYLLASCSRKGGYPMPLQGVWTADNGALPPWKGDYHGDLNLQMSYYHYLKANHLEEGEVLLDFIWSLNEKAQKFASSFYKTKGFCLPAVMTIKGDALGGWPMYSLSPTNQIWTAQLFERHYRYTGNSEFLRQRAYPYLKQTAECIIGLLQKKGNKYYLPFSTSPEIHDDKIESFLTPNTNYDLALMRYLFTALICLSKELDNGEDARWNEYLMGLDDLAVNDDGVLMLSPNEALNESHRHHSHAMAVHPLRLLDYDNPSSKNIIDATVRNLEQLGSGFWVGFSFAWMAEFYAIQKNGNGAAYQLEVFWRNTCSQNGFHLNGDYKNRGTSQFHYRPFTLEANMCAADALQEMLLYSENGVLEIFAAIPDEWQDKDLSFENLRAEKGVLVSAEAKNGEITCLRFLSSWDITIYLRKNKYFKKILECFEGISTLPNGDFVIPLKGKTVLAFSAE